MTTKEKFFYFFYCYGSRVGIGLVLFPIAKDLLYSSAREWNLVSIGIVGVIVQLTGVACLYLAYKAERVLSRRTKP